MASPIQDDGFHEIQLNGKQLVFLFMAATVVSVVIFLCGVLVGRGVRAERSAIADAGTAGAVADPIPQPPAPAPSIPAGSDPTSAAPPPPADDLSYFKRLEKPQGSSEELKAKPNPAPARVAAPPRRAAAPAAQPPVGTTAASDASAADPSGEGFAVQIAALNVRGEAEAIARRLNSKGYAAYVLAPSSGTPTIYRVRVGKFNTRREAETVAAKLQKEEQLKPWVTR